MQGCVKRSAMTLNHQVLSIKPYLSSQLPQRSVVPIVHTRLHTTLRRDVESLPTIHKHKPPVHPLHTKMSIISPFTSPQDVRWKGFQRRHHTIFLVKNIILFLFIILVIVEYPLFKSWWENGPYRPVKSWEYAP
jgi:hypothetical protein